MKSVQFEHENNNNYMVISSENKENNISYQQKMVEKNDIEGLLKMSVKMINNQKKYYYNITSKHKLTQVYEAMKLNYTDVKNIISSLSKVIFQMKNYMLDIDCLLLEPQYMYINMNTKIIEFAYYPEETFDFESSLKSLFEYILEKYDHNSEKMQLMSVYSIYQKIVQGQYDINNLTQLCIDEKYNVSESKKQDDDNLYENITNVSEKVNNDILQNNMKNNTDEKISTENYNNGTVIKGVMPETVDNECEVKSSIENYINIIRVFLVIISAYIMISYFIKQIAIIQLNVYVSCIIAIALLSCSSYLAKLVKGQRFAGKLVNKTIQKEYVIDNKKSEQDNYNEKNYNSVNEQLDNDNCNYINNDNLINTICNKNNHNNYNDIILKKTDIRDNLDLDNNIDSNNNEIKDEFSSGNTVLLSDYIKSNNDTNEKNTVVKLKGDNNEIEINEFPFMIGSMKQYCMYVMENRLISRIHMCLLLKDKQLYLQDMNSTNGTFLNEKRLNPGQEVLLNDGDTIRLANESYIVEFN